MRNTSNYEGNSIETRSVNITFLQFATAQPTWSKPPLPTQSTERPKTPEPCTGTTSGQITLKREFFIGIVFGLVVGLAVAVLISILLAWLFIRERRKFNERRQTKIDTKINLEKLKGTPEERQSESPDFMEEEVHEKSEGIID